MATDYIPTPSEQMRPDMGATAPSTPAKLRAGETIGPLLDKRLQRGRKDMLVDAHKRRLCYKFEKNETYWRIGEQNMLIEDSTITMAGGKPPHKIRNRYNFIKPLVQGKVSAATSKIPSYNVSPTTSDPEDIGASRIAQRIAVYGYDQWNLRDAGKKAVKNAVVGGDTFLWPYFDENVGPFTQQDDGTWKGRGEIKTRVLTGNQVYWEPGVDFADSGWFAVEMALPLDEVKAFPGFNEKINLEADGSSANNLGEAKSARDNLVTTTCYFERPCVKWPTGRYFITANKRVIVAETDYPLKDPEGQVLDEPCIHRLQWDVGNESNREMGLVWELIDFQRTIQDCYNKLLEWKNRTLNPQMMSPEGSMTERRNDIPGYNYEYKPIGGLKPEWETPNANFVAPLQAILQQAKSDMQYIAADQDLSSIVAPNVSTSSIQATVDQANTRWGAFIIELAQWHSKVMRHCLLLASTYYDEPRLIQVRGARAVENIKDFLGASIMDQVNVTVDPSSLEVRSHDQVMQDVFALMDRQMISAQDALQAIRSKDLSILTYSHDLDVERANTIISRIIDGTVMQMPMKELANPTTGEPVEVQSWMPSEQDDPEVWDKIFSDWMKTDQYENLPKPAQEIAVLIHGAVLRQRIAKAQLEAQMQMAQASQLGMTNAAKPQSPGAPPSTPGSAGTPPPSQ